MLTISIFSFVTQIFIQDEVLAISERVVIRADDLLNWCDDTINWTYGLRANTLLDSSIKMESTVEKTGHDDDNNSNNLEHNAGGHNLTTAENDDVKIEEITSTNIRSLKNSKLDFDEVENEKGKQIKDQKSLIKKSNSL